ncbi:TnsA-like heteromeric transposase endonuclease subunit [Streptomyces sp. TRM66268-LWL]|uniref:TnsA-like heteromeric transposase endonuclease subunit n=1 Tax=Streptomyces polyasparticus TaxID=2767826 RepID=A0ABR7SWH9_9ACTN|nr:TnsA-like heteromeric transposase endonuclease subunit [Streptomyces polyasparticus]
MGEDAVAGLELGEGWPQRWSASWRTPGADLVCSISELAHVPVQVTRPARRFTWRQNQRHRPGLKFVQATARMHGFESLEERRLLLAVDFTMAGQLQAVLSQPVRLRFFNQRGQRLEHTPDFLVLDASRVGWLVDVRPAALIEGDDRLRFAAASYASAAAGWRYTVVTRWRSEVMTGLDLLSARRRPMADPLGLMEPLRAQLEERPRQLGELVDASRVPAMARSLLLHDLWLRRLAVDLARPLGDASWIYPVGSVLGAGA